MDGLRRLSPRKKVWEINCTKCFKCAFFFFEWSIINPLKQIISISNEPTEYDVHYSLNYLFT